MEKRTRQRTAIQSVIKAENRPLTPEEIHHLARREIPRLGLSTVYRTLRRMQDEQHLVGVDFPGQPTRYELPTRDAHSHFVCSRCERVFDLPRTPRISSIPLPEGFQAEGYELVVFGVCSGCEGEDS